MWAVYFGVIELQEGFPLTKRLKNMPPVRLIVSSFFAVILLGAVLLTLPIMSRSGNATSMIDALFTATSAQ